MKRPKLVPSLILVLACAAAFVCGVSNRRAAPSAEKSSGAAVDPISFGLDTSQPDSLVLDLIRAFTELKRRGMREAKAAGRPLLGTVFDWERVRSKVLGTVPPDTRPESLAALDGVLREAIVAELSAPFLKYDVASHTPLEVARQENSESVKLRFRVPDPELEPQSEEQPAVTLAIFLRSRQPEKEWRIIDMNENWPSALGIFRGTIPERIKEVGIEKLTEAMRGRLARKRVLRDAAGRIVLGRITRESLRDAQLNETEEISHAIASQRFMAGQPAGLTLSLKASSLFGKMGFVTGDTVRAIRGKPLLKKEELAELFTAAPTEDVITVRMERDFEAFDAFVEIGGTQSE